MVARANRGGVVVAVGLLLGGCSSRPAAPAATRAGSSATTTGSTGSGGNLTGGGTGGAASASSGAATGSAATGSAASSGSSGGGGTVAAATCDGVCGQAGCEAFTCVDGAPQGWLGPFQLYSGPPGQAPSCAAPASESVLSASGDLQQQPAQCSACTAENPHDFSCVSVIAAYTDAACSAMDTAGSIFFGNGFCGYLDKSGYGSAVGYGAPAATYVCDTSTQTPTLPPVSWGTAAVGCAEPSPPANGCASGQLCVPLPQAPFGAGHCISTKDDTACPGSTYAARSLYYTGALDTRSCSKCGYQPADISCTGTSVLYTDTACSSQLEVVTDFSGDCMSLPSSVGSSTLINASFTGTPSCAPAGGDPKGTITPTGPVTVCCTQ